MWGAAVSPGKILCPNRPIQAVGDGGKELVQPLLGAVGNLVGSNSVSRLKVRGGRGVGGLVVEIEIRAQFC